MMANCVTPTRAVQAPTHLIISFAHVLAVPNFVHIPDLVLSVHALYLPHLEP